jgi:hypothetical protein
MSEGLYILIPIAEKFPTTMEDATQAINRAIPDAKAERIDTNFISLSVIDNGIGWSALLCVSFSVFFWELFVEVHPDEIITDENNAETCRRAIKKIVAALCSLDCWYISETRYMESICEQIADGEINLRNINKYSVEISRSLSTDFKWEQPFIHDIVTNEEMEEWS